MRIEVTPMPRRPVKAEQIAATLAERIAQGEFGARGWLPPLRELAKTYDVVERTVTTGLALLAERGLVEIIPSKGTRVIATVVQRDATDITRQVGTWRGFHTAVSRSGAQAYTDTYRIADVTAAPDVADKLGIPVGATVLERARVHGVVVDGNRQPVQVSTTWIISEVVARLPILREHNTGPGGMGSRMEEASYALGYEDVVTARPPSTQEQMQLGITAHQPVIVAWRRAFDQQGSGRPLEVTVRIINPNLHELVYRYI
jgi:GntR family transcriptional regulator